MWTVVPIVITDVGDSQVLVVVFWMDLSGLEALFIVVPACVSTKVIVMDLAHKTGSVVFDRSWALR